MSSPPEFSATPILSYLSLPADYTPSPSNAPIEFLALHLHQLPPNLLALFSALLNPHRRTVLPVIRNRRQRYASTVPRELTWEVARKVWPGLWEGRERERERPGVEQGREEKLWAERGLEFLRGERGRVGKLGQLLGDYEEEREVERMREVRRENMARRELEREQREEEEEEEEGEEEDEVEEEEEGDGDDERHEGGVSLAEEQESPDQMRIAFERIVQEKFIYGLLDSIDYDAVDWDDRWDETEERDSEERWFDEEEEAEAPPMDET